jgi:methylated-DNA-protein-cysteine methyltransferase related protein
MSRSTPDQPTLYERIYAAVSRVPPGYVTTYGAVSRYVGCPARVVGYALHYLRGAAQPEAPWQRVINARGRISTHGDRQRALLESEGVIFESDGSVDLSRYGWPEFW